MTGQWQSGDRSADTKILLSPRNENIVFFQNLAGRRTTYLIAHNLHVNTNGCVRPSIYIPLDSFCSTCLLIEELQPLPFISKLPELSQTSLDRRPGLDTISIIPIMAGPTAALGPTPTLPGSTEVLSLVKYSTTKQVVWLPPRAI